MFSPDLGLESGCFVPEDSEDQVLLTDEALAEAMAASSAGSGPEFANQPGRSEGESVDSYLCFSYPVKFIHFGVHVNSLSPSHR